MQHFKICCVTNLPVVGCLCSSAVINSPASLKRSLLNGVASSGRVILNINPVKESTDIISISIVLEKIDTNCCIFAILRTTSSSPEEFLKIIFIPPY